MSRTDVASRRAMINRRAMLKRLEENTKSDQIPDAKSSLSVLRGMPSIVNSVYVRKDELADMIMDMELPICKAVMITPEAVIFTVMAQSSTKKHTHIPKRIARNLHFRGPIPQSGDWLDLSQLNPDQILKSFQIQSVTYVLDGVTVEVIVTIDVQEFYDTISSV